MLRGFRDFILRGNVIDLAIAVVIGIAFNAVVSAFVKDILTPLIAAIFGKPDFAALTFTVNSSQFAYGDVLDALISFLAVAAAIYFVVVAPMNALAARRSRPAEVATRDCPECLSTIPRAATRCSFCTEKVAPVA
ncbi:MAG: large conductance mechanosensitive channel protein MscL [Candidatus Dormibacteria bacterium]|jgi:large conductance mechanosensitive channel